MTGVFEMKDKKLYKSVSDRKISGVCAGLAEFLGIDVTIIRILWVCFALSGAGLIAYIVCAFVMPDGPPKDYDYYDDDERRN
jgi:phage shock protein C